MKALFLAMVLLALIHCTMAIPEAPVVTSIMPIEDETLIATWSYNSSITGVTFVGSLASAEEIVDSFKVIDLNTFTFTRLKTGSYYKFNIYAQVNGESSETVSQRTSTAITLFEPKVVSITIPDVVVPIEIPKDGFFKFVSFPSNYKKIISIQFIDKFTNNIVLSATLSPEQDSANIKYVEISSVFPASTYSVTITARIEYRTSIDDIKLKNGGYMFGQDKNGGTLLREWLPVPLIQGTLRASAQSNTICFLMLIVFVVIFLIFQ